MQPVLLHVLDQRAAGPMHDAFGPAGRAGGEHDEQRMVEREPLPLERPPGPSCDERSEGVHREAHAGQGCSAVERNDHPQRRQRRHDLRHARGHGHPSVVQGRPGMGEQHRRLDLAETVNDALHSHLRRRRRDAGPDRCRAERGQHGVGVVARDDADAVTDAKAEIGQRPSQRPDLFLQFRPTEPMAPAITPDRSGRWPLPILVTTVGKQVFDVVEANVREEGGRGARRPEAGWFQEPFATKTGPIHDSAPKILVVHRAKRIERAVV